MIAPLHSSLGKKSKTLSQERKKKLTASQVRLADQSSGFETLLATHLENVGDTRASD